MKLKETFLQRPVFRQTLLAICISMSFFCIGLVRGYSSPAILSIKDNDPYILPTQNIASWACSIPPFGAFCGSILAIFLLQRFGRKHTIMLASPVGALGWILISTANRYELFILGRYLGGFSVGLSLSSAQVYISESCDPKIRGILGSLPSIMMSFGILMAYIIGSFIKWNIFGWICFTFTASLILIISFLPESPVWLQNKKRFHHANLSANWLKLPAIEPISTIAKSNSGKSENFRKVLFTRPILMPITIGFTLLILQQISGIDTIIFYTVEIFRSSGSTIDEHLASIIVGFVQLISNISSLFIVDRFGRKPLLLVSAVIMCISMGSMGTAFFLHSHGNQDFGFLPLISLIVFMFGYSIGFGCIPFLLMGELFPNKYRSILSTIAGSFNLGFMFIVVKTYHYFEDLITIAGTYWMYSIFCAIGIFFVIFVVPETKGHELENIHKLFANNSNEMIQKKETSINVTKL